MPTTALILTWARERVIPYPVLHMYLHLWITSNLLCNYICSDAKRKLFFFNIIFGANAFISIFQHTNKAHQVIYATAMRCFFLRNVHTGRIRTRIFSSSGGCDDQCAKPPERHAETLSTRFRCFLTFLNRISFYFLVGRLFDFQSATKYRIKKIGHHSIALEAELQKQK
jgi:hypothetical protein